MATLVLWSLLVGLTLTLRRLPSAKTEPKLAHALT